MKKTNFFIAGAPKCGTTSVYYWLKQHSRIYFPDIKEPHYFADDLHENKRIIKQENEYKCLYSKATHRHQILGDASVFYLYSRRAAVNIVNYNEEAKFLVLLRNPIEMAISLHAQYVYTGNELYNDFETAWRMKDKRHLGVGVSRITDDPQLLHYGKVCKLGEQVQKLLDNVHRKQVMFVFLDDIKKDAEAVLDSLFLFLNIQPEPIQTGLHNKAAKRKYPAIARFLKHLNTIKKDLGIRNLNTGFGQKADAMNTEEISTSTSSITGELKAEMEDYFRDDLELLTRLIGREGSYKPEFG